MLAAVMPLPSEEVTPPVTKTYFAMGWVLRGFSNGTGRRLGASRRRSRARRTLRGRPPGSGGCRPRRVLDPRAPDLGAAEDRAAGRGREGPRPDRPPQASRRSLSQAWISANSVHRSKGQPASQADRDQGALGEDHVGVAGRVAIALAVTDEDDHPPRRPGGPAPAARLQVPHTKQSGWPLGKSIRALPPPANVVRAGDDRQVGQAEPGQVRPDEEPEAVADHLDRDARGAARWANGTKPGSCGLDRGRVQQLGLGRRGSGRPPTPSAARAHPAGIVDRGDSLPVRVRDVLGHDRVAHVGQGDRAVVVDQDRHRRRVRVERCRTAGAASRTSGRRTPRRRTRRRPARRPRRASVRPGQSGLRRCPGRGPATPRRSPRSA